jgi:hypothetical protein
MGIGALVPDTPSEVVTVHQIIGVDARYLAVGGWSVLVVILPVSLGRPWHTEWSACRPLFVPSHAGHTWVTKRSP